MAEKKRRHFPVVIEEDEDGRFIVSCPLLRGCRTYGETQEEALVNIREAIELCLEEESGEGKDCSIRTNRNEC